MIKAAILINEPRPFSNISFPKPERLRMKFEQLGSAVSEKKFENVNGRTDGRRIKSVTIVVGSKTWESDNVKEDGSTMFRTKYI